MEAAECGGNEQEGGQRPDEAVWLNGLSLSLCSGGPLDLLQGVVPFKADHVQSPAGEVDAGLMGGILRDKFSAGLASISDAQLNHTAKFTVVGVKPVDYDKGMKVTRHHIARGWKVSWAESKKQPYTPWSPDPDREYPARKAHHRGRGHKHQRKQDPEEQVDLIAASDLNGEPEAKHQRRCSPRRYDRSAPRRRSPRYRHDSPPASAAVPTAISGRIPVNTQATLIDTPRPPSCPPPTRGTSTTPRLPWRTTPTPPRHGALQLTHTATNRTSGVTRGTARTRMSGVQ